MIRLFLIVSNAALGYYWIAYRSDYQVGLFSFVAAFYVTYMMPVEVTKKIKKDKHNGKAIQNRPR